ncbi:MAG: transcription antitermination factor NusB [Spirochaetes bacterium]|jgi:N utilization substance protein B|nr:transcription antitermination factor NusB [Spirochaetota bacterium]
MGHRRKAREYALQALYMYETVKCPVDELCALKWVNKEIPEDIRDFTIKLISGCVGNLDFIDKLIVEYARNWDFERIGAVDKAILRISIYTLLYLPDIPGAVAINEGVELGKAFGGDASGQFINGLLDAIKKSELISGDRRKS